MSSSSRSRNRSVIEGVGIVWVVCGIVQIGLSLAVLYFTAVTLLSQPDEHVPGNPNQHSPTSTDGVEFVVVSILGLAAWFGLGGFVIRSGWQTMNHERTRLRWYGGQSLVIGMVLIESGILILTGDLQPRELKDRGWVGWPIVGFGTVFFVTGIVACLVPTTGRVERVWMKPMATDAVAPVRVKTDEDDE